MNQCLKVSGHIAHPSLKATVYCGRTPDVSSGHHLASNACSRRQRDFPNAWRGDCYPFSKGLEVWHDEQTEPPRYLGLRIDVGETLGPVWDSELWLRGILITFGIRRYGYSESGRKTTRQSARPRQGPAHLAGQWRESTAQNNSQAPVGGKIGFATGQTSCEGRGL